jgi:hypothetical protein
VTEKYYFKAYAPEMPDFNWENNDCRKLSMRLLLSSGLIEALMSSESIQ